MINKKYFKELEKVVPNMDEQSKMLNKILNKKTRIAKPMYSFGLVFSCMIIFVLLIAKTNIESIKITPSNYRVIEEKVIYNGNNYSNIGLYDGNINKLIKSNESLELGPVYMIPDSDDIVIIINELYIKYERCEEK